MRLHAGIAMLVLAATAWAQMSDDEAMDFCETQSQLGYVIMKSYQNGDSLAYQIKTCGNGTEDVMLLCDALIEGARSHERQSSPELRKMAAQEFRDTLFEACWMEMRK